MIIIVKKIPGNECNIEVSTNSTVIYVKELVAKHLQIPVGQQKLVFKGKTLSDNMSLEDYDISEGNKLHLFVVDTASPAPLVAINPSQVSSGDSSRTSVANDHYSLNANPFWIQLTQVLQKYYTMADTAKIVDEFRRNLQSDVNELSLDDIERLAKIKLTQQQLL